MTDVPSPRLPADDPNRAIEREMYLEPALANFADAAVVAGWTEDEVEATLLKLAKTRILKRVRPETDETIKHDRRSSLL
jgi:hypothetical protein